MLSKLEASLGRERDAAINTIRSILAMTTIEEIRRHAAEIRRRKKADENADDLTKWMTDKREAIHTASKVIAVLTRHVEESPFAGPGDGVQWLRETFYAVPEWTKFQKLRQAYHRSTDAWREAQRQRSAKWYANHGDDRKTEAAKKKLADKRTEQRRRKREREQAEINRTIRAETTTS